MSPTEHVPPAAEVAQLLEERGRVQGWLSELDRYGNEVSERVRERVRGDYQQRLSRVMDALAAHVEALHTELASVQERLEQVQREHEQAEEALEEMRLRHRLGEFDDEAWSARRPELEAAVTDARTRREEVRAEVDHLQEILEQVERGSPVPPPAPEAVAPEEPREAEPAVVEEEDEEEAEFEEAPLAAAAVDADVQEEAEEDPLAFLSGLPGSDEADATLEAPADPEDAKEGGDATFLEMLDRAIAKSSDASAGGDAEEDSEAFRPQPGTKCPECGYTNDQDAWYCGVCGVDLS